MNEDQPVHKAQGSEGTGGERAPIERAQPAGLPESMAESVTRHAHFSGPPNWKFLSNGIDTLDLGLHIEWSDQWKEVSAYFDQWKDAASNSEGLPINGGLFLMRPNGKPPQFRWHLQFPLFNLFLGRSQSPRQDKPNGYVSLSSEMLWLKGIPTALRSLSHVLDSFGGTLLRAVPSRTDVAADFLIPKGLSLGFLQSHQVPAHYKVRPYLTGDRLETYYVGDPSSPIQLRIYDKGLEINATKEKYWFRDVWNIEDVTDVWRIEFQLRRRKLKEYGINSIALLLEKLQGLWFELTDWVSFRFPDNPNATRRTLHPLWEAVRDNPFFNGPSKRPEKIENVHPQAPEWYVSHVAGCLASYAAIIQQRDANTAWDELGKKVNEYWKDHDFDSRFVVRSIQRGFDVTGSGS